MSIIQPECIFNSLSAQTGITPLYKIWMRLGYVNWICLLTSWLRKARDTTRAASSSIHPTFGPQIMVRWLLHWQWRSLNEHSRQARQDFELSSILKEGLIERSSITLAQKIKIKIVGVKHRLIHCLFVTYIWDWY